MKEPKSCLKVIILFLFLTCLAASIGAQIKEAPNPAPDNSRFRYQYFFYGEHSREY